MTDRRQDRILDAAHDCVMAVGVRRTTMTDVARRAGISRMTLYRAFPDTGAVLTALMTREFQAVIAGERAALESLPDGRARLIEGTVRIVARLAEHPLLRRIVEVDPELLLPYLLERLGATQRAAMAALEQVLSEGVADRSIRPLDSAAAAYVLLLAGQSLIVSARISEAERRADAALVELRELLDAYLRPRE